MGTVNRLSPPDAVAALAELSESEMRRVLAGLGEAERRAFDADWPSLGA